MAGIENYPEHIKIWRYPYIRSFNMVQHNGSHRIEFAWITSQFLFMRYKITSTSHLCLGANYVMKTPKLRPLGQKLWPKISISYYIGIDFASNISSSLGTTATINHHPSIKQDDMPCHAITSLFIYELSWDEMRYYILFLMVCTWYTHTIRRVHYSDSILRPTKSGMDAITQIHNGMHYREKGFAYTFTAESLCRHFFNDCPWSGNP